MAVSAVVAALLSSPAQAQLPPGGPWSLRFADEFDEAYAGNSMGLDPDKWSPAYPWGRTHNYPAYIRDENILVNTNNNGLLQLWGKRENFGGQPFTSGAINSAGHLNFALPGQTGYMEASMKMPNFLGAWPAFWSLQEGWPPEIDVLEFVRNGAGGPNTSPNNYVANVHFSTPSGNASSWSGFRDAGAGDLTSTFHNYGIAWTNNTLTWYIDGRQFHSYTGADAISQMQRMYLIFNLGIGGWPGDPPANENVNKSFDIDWVRVWQANDATQSNFVGPSGVQDWENGANWSSGAPKLASTTAFFGSLSSGTAATLDWVDTKTVRGLTFKTHSNYRIGWEDDQLMLSNWDSSANAIPEALIDVQVDPTVGVQGTQTIASRVELYSNTRVKNATTNALTFVGDVHGAGALTLDSGKTVFNGAVFHRGGTYVVGSADATFSKSLGTSSSGIYVGTAAGATSTLRLASNATTVAASDVRIGDAGGTGNFVQSGGAVTVTGGEMWVGQGAGSTGTYDHTAGSLTVSNWLAIGRQGGTGTYRLSGTGVLNKLGPNNIIIGSLGGVGTFTQIGGTVSVQSGSTLLGEDAGAFGTYTISGGTATLGDIILSQRGAGRGTFNLDGGTVTANRVGRAGTGTATFNFNGGKLRAERDNIDLVSSLTSANVKAGGAAIDTSGFTVSLSQPLLHDQSLGATLDGGLSKSGLGTLTLSGASTYTGPTTVSAGTLNINGSIASATTVNGGLLGGTGTITGNVLVNTAGSIGAGTSVESLNITGTYSQSGKMIVEIAGGGVSGAGAGTQYDLIAATGIGTINSGSVIDVNLLGFAPGAGKYFDVFTALNINGAGNSLAGITFDYSDAVLTPGLSWQQSIVSTGGHEALRLAVRFPGDANSDNVVTFDDLNTLLTNYGLSGAFESGDFNSSGTVDFSDLNMLLTNYGLAAPQSASAAPVPEPGTLLLAALGILSLLVVARRKR